MRTLPYIKSKKLLNIDNNAKTVKGQKKGYKTAILYLAPSTQSGFNVCPQASEGCKKACLYTAGHGAFNNVQQGRINKTRWFIQERDTFMEQLTKEITNHIKNTTRKGFIPCIRLNGTSDISWETMGIFEQFPQVQFYDYTKIYKRALKFVNGQYPSNYHLTYSLNEDNYKEAFDILLRGGNISAVFRKDLPQTYKGYKVINADETDLRFTDDNNVICGLVAKGQAKKDYSGFVLD
jgi:hypothetical protein|tara:strand:+ start:1411 stop:2118 length:708 start_codon:yes stop_codon:yes gene_type:complete